jgi:hypothetical protein
MAGSQVQLFWAGGGGGGGGSSFLPPGSGTVTDGVGTGSGFVTINWEPTPVLTTEPADAISQGVATLRGTINPSGTASTYHFEYGKSTEYGGSTPEAVAGAGTATDPASAQVDGLEPGAEYHYRIVGSTCGGCPLGTDTGVDRTFTTPGAPRIDGPDKGKARLGKKRTFTVPGVEVGCPVGGEDCAVTATVTKGSARKRRAGALAASSFAVAAGHGSAVSLKATKKAARKVARKGKLKTLVVVEATAGPAKATKTVALKLKPRKRKRR